MKVERAQFFNAMKNLDFHRSIPIITLSNMKQVVTQSNTVNIQNIDPEKYYGTFCDECGKGFVTRQDYEEGDYTILSVREVTKGNGFNQYNDILLFACLRNFLKAKKSRKVFEFDTAQELFKWLAE